MQAEFHLHRTHSQKQETNQRKHSLFLFTINEKEKAQWWEQSNGKTPKEAHKQAKQNKANAHTIKPVQCKNNFPRGNGFKNLSNRQLQNFKIKKIWDI